MADRKNRTAMLLSDQIAFKLKNQIKDKKEHYILAKGFEDCYSSVYTH